MHHWHKKSFDHMISLHMLYVLPCLIFILSICIYIHMNVDISVCFSTWLSFALFLMICLWYDLYIGTFFIQVPYLPPLGFWSVWLNVIYYIYILSAHDWALFQNGTCIYMCVFVCVCVFSVSPFCNDSRLYIYVYI